MDNLPVRPHDQSTLPPGRLYSTALDSKFVMMLRTRCGCVLTGTLSGIRIGRPHRSSARVSRLGQALAEQRRQVDLLDRLVVGELLSPALLHQPLDQLPQQSRVGEARFERRAISLGLPGVSQADLHGRDQGGDGRAEFVRRVGQELLPLRVGAARSARASRSTGLPSARARAAGGGSRSGGGGRAG